MAINVDLQELDNFLTASSKPVDPYGVAADGHTSAKVNNYANLENSITNTDGVYDSNANKIWNNLSNAELQAYMGNVFNQQLGRDEVTGQKYQLLPDADGNLQRVDFNGRSRRMYGYNTKDQESEAFKLGLSTGKYDSSDPRYDSILGHPSGEKGVDVKRKIFDIELPYEVATEGEAVFHGNVNTRAERLVRLDDAKKRKLFGSGASEYYTSLANTLGDVSQQDLTNLTIPKIALSDEDQFKLLPPPTRAERLQALAPDVEAYFNSKVPDVSLASKLGNAGKAAAFRAIEGIANAVDLIPEVGEYLYNKASDKDAKWGDVKGLFGEKEEKALKNFIGYDDRPMQQAAKEAKEAALNAYEKGDWWGVVRAVGKGLTTPELVGESAGFIIGMLLPSGIAVKGVKTVSGVTKKAKAIQTMAQASGIEMKIADAMKIAEASADTMYHLTKLLAGQAGQIGYAEQVAREADTEYKKLYGEEQSGARRTGSFLLGLVSANLDTTMGKMIMTAKDPMAQAIRTALLQATPKQGADFVKLLAVRLGISTGRIVAAMGEEGFTEGLQSTLEFTAERYKDGNLREILTSKDAIARIGGEAILGAAGGAQFAAPSTAKQFLFGEESQKPAISPDELEVAFTAGKDRLSALIAGDDIEDTTPLPDGEIRSYMGKDTSATYDVDEVRPIIMDMLLNPKETYTKAEQEFIRSNKESFDTVVAEGVTAFAKAKSIQEANAQFAPRIEALRELVKGDPTASEATTSTQASSPFTNVTDPDIIKDVIRGLVMQPVDAPVTSDMQNFLKANIAIFEEVVAEGGSKIKEINTAKHNEALDLVDKNTKLHQWAYAPVDDTSAAPEATEAITKETIADIQEIKNNYPSYVDRVKELAKVPGLSKIDSTAAALGIAREDGSIEEKMVKIAKLKAKVQNSGGTAEEANFIAGLGLVLGAGIGVDFDWKESTGKQLNSAVDAQTEEGGPGARVITVERTLKKGTVADTKEEVAESGIVTAFSDSEIMEIVDGNTDIIANKIQNNTKIPTSLNRIHKYTSHASGVVIQKKLQAVRNTVNRLVNDPNIKKPAFVEQSQGNKEAAAFRMVAVAVNQIHSALVSSIHEALNEDMLTMPQGAALYKVAAQIGKDLIHSYGLNFRGAQATVAEAHTKLGLQAIQLVKDAGLVTIIDNDVVPAAKNLRAKDGTTEGIQARAGLIEKTDVASNETVYVGPSIVLNDLDAKNNSPKGIASGSATADAFKILAPVLLLGNKELPSQTPPADKVQVDKPTGTSKNAETGESKQLDTVKQLNQTPLRLKGSAIAILTELKKEYDAAVKSNDTLSIMNFIRQREYLRLALGMPETTSIKGSFLEESVLAANWATAQSFRDIMDNLDALVGDELYFTYKIDGNDRISLTNTVLNFQHDKVVSRWLLSMTEPSTTTSKKEFDFLINSIADELKIYVAGKKLSKEEVVRAILHPGVNKKIDSLIKALFNRPAQKAGELEITINPLKIVAESMKKGQIFEGYKSGFKILALLEAVNDVRNRETDYGVTTSFMVAADARASGVMNTLINLIGRTVSSASYNNLKTFLGAFGLKLKGEQPVAKMDPYSAVLNFLKRVEDETGVDESDSMYKKLSELADKFDVELREFIKPLVMVWFYGKNVNGIKQTVGDTLALAAFKKAVAFDGGTADTALIAEIRSIIGRESNDLSSINNLSAKDFKILASHYREKYADALVDTLSDMYPQVTQYRDDMRNIHDVLTTVLKGHWKGEFPSAVATMFGEEGGDIRTTKHRDVIIQDASDELGGLPLFAYLPQLNKSSLPVNPQHSQDAAQLLYTLYTLFSEGRGTNGLITVHDNIMGSVSDVMNSQDIYNDSYIKSATEYDYIEQALKLIDGLFDTAGLTEQEIAVANHKLKDIRERNAAAFEKKKELLNGSSAEIFGIRSSDIIGTDNIEAPELKAGPEETTPAGTASKPTKPLSARIANTNQDKLAEVVNSGNYVLLDTETTGLVGDRDASGRETAVAHQIAVAVYEEGKQITLEVINVNGKAAEELRKTYKLLPDGFNALEGRNEENDTHTKEEAAAKINELIGGRNVITKSANSLDMEMLQRLGVNADLATEFYSYEDLAQSKLLEDYKNLGFNHDNQHTAEVDINNMNVLLQTAAAANASHPLKTLKHVETVEQLLEVLKYWSSHTYSVIRSPKIGDMAKDAIELVAAQVAAIALRPGLRLKVEPMTGKEERFSYNMNDRSITIDELATPEELAKYLLHEIEHDLTAAYILNNKDASEVKYLAAVVKRLKSKSDSLGLVSEATKKRIAYILGGKATTTGKKGSIVIKNELVQVAELVAVLRSEDAAATEIASLIFEDGNKKSFIRRLLDAANKLVQDGWKAFAEAGVKEIEINFDNTVKALKQVRDSAAEYNAKLKADTSKNATKKSTKQADINLGSGIIAKAAEEINNSALPETAKQDMLEKLTGCM